MEKFNKILDIVLKALALGMGVAVVVLSVMKKIEIEQICTMLGLGLSCLAVVSLKSKGE